MYTRNPFVIIVATRIAGRREVHSFLGENGIGRAFALTDRAAALRFDTADAGLGLARGVWSNAPHVTPRAVPLVEPVIVAASQGDCPVAGCEIRPGCYVPRDLEDAFGGYVDACPYHATDVLVDALIAAGLIEAPPSCSGTYEPRVGDWVIVTPCQGWAASVAGRVGRVDNVRPGARHELRVRVLIDGDPWVMRPSELSRTARPVGAPCDGVPVIGEVV